MHTRENGAILQIATRNTQGKKAAAEARR